MLSGKVAIPPYTTEKSVAEEMEGDVVCRTLIRSHSGKGIVIRNKESGEPLPDAKLYVRYIKKKDEYRVHVINGEVVAVHRKARLSDVPDEDVNWKIRNRGNGFTYARNEDREYPEQVREIGLKAIEAIGLDFGAADVIWNEHHKTAYVLEINTAPGLAGELVDIYAEKLGEML